MSHQFVLGLTGGIACGKSSVSRILSDLSLPVIDADLVVRDLQAPGAPLYDWYVRELGPQILAPDGTLDRPALREKVFADPSLLERINAAFAPLIRAAITARIAKARGPYVVLSVPLLLEQGYRDLCDRLLVVDASEAVQIARIKKRDGCSESTARAMLSAQCPRAERVAAASDLIVSDGLSLEDLRGIVLKLHARYLEMAGAA